MSEQSPKELFKKVFGFYAKRLGFEVVGSIAVLEVEKGVDKELLKRFAGLILQSVKPLKTVLLKTSGRVGEFRVQGLDYLAGAKTFKTLHRENNYLLMVDLTKAYFSPRLANERLRIARLVNPDEKVLVMFSGVAPYVVAIARHANPDLVVGVEKNFEAHELAIQNVAINKLLSVELYNADVKDYARLEKRAFDRIVMPLPMHSELFLKEAVKLSKHKAMIHLYLFSSKQELKPRILSIKEKLASLGFSLKNAQPVQAGQFASRQYRWCLDLRVEKESSISRTYKT